MHKYNATKNNVNYMLMLLGALISKRGHPFETPPFSLHKLIF
jgi:hypothetical protein